MPPLIPHLPLEQGETITGYVSRNAALFQATPRDFCSDLGMRWPFLCSGREDQLERLAWLTDQPLEVLKARHTPKVEAKRYKVGGAITGTDVFRRTAIRFCPMCVVEQLREGEPERITQMLEWSVLCLRRCPIHHCEIISLPSAPYSHDSYDFVGQILANRPAVLAASDASRILPSTEFETYLRQRIWDGPHSDWLRDADISDIHGACGTLGASLSGLRVREFGSVSVECRSELVSEGFRHLRAGPNVYLAALQDRYAKGVGRPLPESDFGVHFGWLRRNASRSQVASLVQVAREHVTATYPVSLDKELLGVRPPRKRLLTMEEARAKSGFGAVFLKKLIGHIDGQEAAEAVQRTDVHVDDLLKAERRWKTMINLTDAAKELCILPAQVRQLQDRGVLSLIRITSSLRYTLRQDVASLLETLQDLAPASPGAVVLPLKEYCRRNGVPLARVVELWANSELSEAAFCIDANGLHALAILEDHVVDRADTSLRGDLEVPQAARYLRINVPAIRSLRDNGYLTEIQRKNPDTRYIKGYITRDSITQFETAFMTLGQLASLRGVAPMHLARELDRAGLDPVPDLGPGVRIYERRLFLPS